MAEALRSMGRLLWRSAKTLPGSLGQTWLGTFFPVLVFLFTEFIWFLADKGEPNMLSNWERETLISAGIALASWAGLYLWCIAVSIYREHRSLCDQLLLSGIQNDLLRLARDMRSFMARHQNYPIELENPTNSEFDDWNRKKWLPWLTKFHAEYQDLFSARLRTASLQLKKLGISDAHRLEGWAIPCVTFPDGCLTPIALLLDLLIAVECQSGDGRAEFIREEVLTPLQEEAFWIAKDLRDFLDSLGERPITKAPDYTQGQTAEQLAQYAHGRLFGPEGQWLSNFREKYAARFPKRIEEFMLRFKEEDDTIVHPDFAANVQDDRQLLKVALDIETRAIWLNYKVKSGVSENGAMYENRISRRR